MAELQTEHQAALLGLSEAQEAAERHGRGGGGGGGSGSGRGVGGGRGGGGGGGGGFKKGGRCIC